jgi:DNA-binding NtrC family response regulator
VIAMIVGDEAMRQGPVPLALAHAGFETRDAHATQDADSGVERHGAAECVWIVDTRMLEARAVGAEWSAFLIHRRELPAVVIAHGAARPEVRAATREPNRVLLEDPFDAAAVVMAARRVSECGAGKSARGRPRRPAARGAARQSRGAGARSGLTPGSE